MGYEVITSSSLLYQYILERYTLQLPKLVGWTVESVHLQAFFNFIMNIWLP